METTVDLSLDYIIITQVRMIYHRGVSLSEVQQ